MAASSISAMAFHNPLGLVPAFDQASAFASGGGRVATIPDILQARLGSEPGGVAWSCYFTTTSAEYYGRSPGGVPLLVVAHGVGPMANLVGILGAYAYEFDDKTRSRRGGRVSNDVFQDLVEGKFGEVCIVDLRTLLRDYEHPFGGRSTEEVLSHPLWVARLGGPDMARRYVVRHSGYALADLMDQGSAARGHNPYPGRILQMRESKEAPYTRVVPTSDNRWRYAPNEVEHGMAYAHLLSIGQLTSMRYPDSAPRTHLQSDIAPHNWRDGARFAAVRPGYEFGAIHPGFSDLARRSSQDLLWQEDTGGMATFDGFHALMRISGDWFTQHPKVGEAVDSYQPEHAVVSMETVGGPVCVSVKSDGSQGPFRYAAAEFQRVAPPRSNAYALASQPLSTNDLQQFLVQFYRVAVDRSRRLPTAEEVYRNFDLMLQLASAPDAGL